MSEKDALEAITIPHKFLARGIDPETQTLIIGTFNPATDKNPATFFYSRGKNYLWRLLPAAFGEQDMRQNSLEEKIKFIKRHKIDFIDQISAIRVEKGKEANYADAYIDCRVAEWRNVIQEINHLDSLKRICFTRKTFIGIPRLKEKIAEIQQYCNSKAIVFKCLTTPARFYSEAKQAEWDQFFSA